MDAIKVGYAADRIAIGGNPSGSLQGFEVLHQIPLLIGGQPQLEMTVVMVHDRIQRGESPVVIEAALVDFLCVEEGA